MTVQRVSAADDNLLDDVMCSTEQAMYDKLLSASEFEEQQPPSSKHNNDGELTAIAEITVETVLDQDSALNILKREDGMAGGETSFSKNNLIFTHGQF